MGRERLLKTRGRRVRPCCGLHGGPSARLGSWDVVRPGLPVYRLGLLVDHPGLRVCHPGLRVYRPGRHACRPDLLACPDVRSGRGRGHSDHHLSIERETRERRETRCKAVRTHSALRTCYLRLYPSPGI